MYLFPPNVVFLYELYAMRRRSTYIHCDADVVFKNLNHPSSLGAISEEVGEAFPSRAEGCFNTKGSQQ